MTYFCLYMYIDSLKQRSVATKGELSCNLISSSTVLKSKNSLTSGVLVLCKLECMSLCVCVGMGVSGGGGMSAKSSVMLRVPVPNLLFMSSGLLGNTAAQTWFAVESSPEALL